MPEINLPKIQEDIEALIFRVKMSVGLTRLAVIEEYETVTEMYNMVVGWKCYDPKYRP